MLLTAENPLDLLEPTGMPLWDPKAPLDLVRSGEMLAPAAVGMAAGDGAQLAADRASVIATRPGVAAMDRQGRVGVVPVLDVWDVDFQSGPLHFDGIVRVRGSVKAGLSVTATRGIVVSGNLEGGTLCCDGFVQVYGMVLSGSVIQAETQGAVRFARDARIAAREDLHVGTNAFHCHLRAGRRLFVGRKLVGGTAAAGCALMVDTVGSTGGEVTHLEIDARLVQLGLFRDLSTLERLHEKVREGLALIKGFPADPAAYRALIAQKVKIRVELTRLRAQLAAHDGTLDGEVVVTDGLWPGACVTIGGREQLIGEWTSRRTYRGSSPVAQVA